MSKPRRLLDDDALNELHTELVEAKRPVIVIGGGCGAAVGSILELALLLDAPVVVTPHGKGFVSPYHPQFRGVFGFAGHASATGILTDPDVDRVLAIGTTMGEWASGAWDQDALLNQRLIHIDDVEEHFSRSAMARLHVSGDLETLFDRLVDRIYQQQSPGSVRFRHMGGTTGAPGPAGIERIHQLQPPDPSRSVLQFKMENYARSADDGVVIKPQRLMEELTRLFPISTCFLADSGNSLAWAIHHLHPLDRRVHGARHVRAGLFRACLEFAPMGWAIGAAVGTALARPAAPVVCITGDGSVLMSGQEITVAVAECLCVIFVVLNDSALGMVKHGQRLAGAEPVGFELPPVDFCAMAKALGADAHEIRSVRDLRTLDINAICSRRGPTLLDVYIDPEEIPPMGTRMKVLGTPG